MDNQVAVKRSRDDEALNQSQSNTIGETDKSPSKVQQIGRRTLDVSPLPSPLKESLDREQDGNEASTDSSDQEFGSERESFRHPFYENFALTTSGAYQQFSLPRPQVRALPSWTEGSEDHYNNIGSVTSSAELITDNSPAASPVSISSIPNHIDIMNNYPYQGSGGSNSSIYHNIYSYSGSHTSSSARDDVPYASIKQNNSRLKKIRSDNVSPAVSNTTASTGLSSARGTTKRQQKSGEYAQHLTATIPRPVGTMSRTARSQNASTLYYSTPGPGGAPHDHIVVPVPVQACQGSPYCTGCTAPMQLGTPTNHLETIPEMCSLKTDSTLYWNYNNNNIHIPLKRNSSIGGFTLNGQPRLIKKSKMSRFCSSHKIALVVSTFSMLVTLGLVITLILMKKKGMMEAM